MLDGPITKERAEAAADWMAHNAAEMAHAKADREKSDHMLKVTLSQQFLLHEGTVAQREHLARSSPEYLAAIDRCWHATVTHEEFAARNRAAQAVIEMWRSINASTRSL